MLWRPLLLAISSSLFQKTFELISSDIVSEPAAAERHQTYVGDAKEIEFQDSNDWPVHVLPLREVVTQPVATMLPTADKCRPTQDKRSLSSCLLGSAVKKCDKVIKKKNGNWKSHMISLSFQVQFYLEGCYSWKNYYCGPKSHENVTARLQIMESFTQWPKLKTKIYLIHKTICFRHF